MPPEDLLKLIQQRPFTPFKMYLTDGTAYDIRHPEMVLPGRRSAVVGLAADPAQPLYDRTVTVSLLHIVRLEPAETTSSSNGNS